MIKAENIASKEFRKSLYGYDCEEVDRYLDELIVQLKQMEQERLEMATTIEYLVSIVQKDTLSLPDTYDVVAPVSPHELESSSEPNALDTPKIQDEPADAEPPVQEEEPVTEEPLKPDETSSDT